MKQTKRILAVLLAVALVCSLLSVIPATAIDAGQSITYTYGTNVTYKAAWNDTCPDYNASGRPGTGRYDGNQAISADPETAWYSYEFTLADGDDGYFVMTLNKLRWQTSDNGGQKVKITIDNTVVGYMVASGDRWMSVNSDSGTLQTGTVTDTGLVSGTQVPFSLEAGTHEIKFTACGNGTEKWRYYWEGFTLTAYTDGATVSAQIAALGEITLEKADAVAAARTAYNSLSTDEQAKVANLDVLEAAEITLEMLNGVYWAYRYEDADNSDVAFIHQAYDASGNNMGEGIFSRANLTAADTRATYQIPVATAGTFNLTIRYRTHESTGSADVYVNGVKLETALVPEGNANSCNNLDLGTVTLQAGDNEIQFISTEHGANSNGYGVNIFTFTITPASAPVVDPLTVLVPGNSVDANGDVYDITWNVNLKDNSEEGGFVAFNDQYRVLECGVIVTATVADMDTYADGLLAGGENVSGKAYKEVFVSGDNAVVYSNFSYRRTGASAGVTRCTKFYLVVTDGEETLTFTSDTNSALVAAN